jgi:hypothetical protein
MRNFAADLRGSLRHESIDARRAAMAAKNASCARLSAMVMIGVDPNAVARGVFGFPDNSEQSALALRQGKAFEWAQTRDGAARLLRALHEAGILETEDIRVLDLAQLPGFHSPISAARMQAAQRGVVETDRALRSKLAGSVDVPHVILQAHLRLPLRQDGEEIIVRPDALIARSTQARYRVGEIKSFTALRHLTDEEDVASASAQAGIYSVALEASLRGLGSNVPIPTEAVLVFRKPGSVRALPTLQHIDRDIETARRLLDQGPRSLRDLENILGHGRALDKPANVLRLPVAFMGACRSFCPMWQVCLDEARGQGIPSVLGKDVEEAIGALSSTQRARDLMAGAAPSNELERDLQCRLLAYLTELKEATA